MKSIENALKEYHKSEAAGSMGIEPKKEINRCVEHYEKTQRFAEDGKFSLRLPFKTDRSKVSSNRRLALISLFKLEKKLHPILKIEYVKFIREYFEMGHAEFAPLTNDNCYFIPHRAVIREESSTTPVRVVFNASSHERGEISLNDALMIGPQIQRELFDILISVRSYLFVFSADIAKMYRIIWIDEKDRDMQRILWRESPDQPIREYRLNTVTYGTTPASFMATQCLEIVARKIEGQYPEAAQLIREHFYMDDLIASGDNIDRVKCNLKIIHDSLAAYGFHLRKYSANS